MMRYVIICCFCLALTGSANAQFKDSTKEVKTVVDTGHFHMQKSPMLALVLSGLLPGSGQIYTGVWYWAPVFAGGIVGCLLGASIQNGRYHVDIDSVKAQHDRGDTYNENRYTAQREFYRDDRDKFYIYAGLIYIANILHAYISAHLFDFDVSDATSTAAIEAPRTREEPWRLALRVRF